TPGLRRGRRPGRVRRGPALREPATARPARHSELDAPGGLWRAGRFRGRSEATVSGDSSRPRLPWSRGSLSVGPGTRSLAMSERLKPGDWIEVRSRDEILGTLDADGRLEGMIFMPEMLQFCGRRFRVE